MDITLREAKRSDIAFLKEMLYEAVFWRNPQSRPFVLRSNGPLPEVSIALEDWGKRDGDAAVIAYADSMPVGAAWYRYWKKSSNTRGYVNENIPVLAIAVKSGYRHMGIGKNMMEWMGRLCFGAANRKNQPLRF